MLQSVILLKSVLVENPCSFGRHSCGKQTDLSDKRRDGASAGAVSSCVEQSIKGPNGETAGIDLEKSKGATSMSVGCNGESAGAACASMSIGGHEELARVACSQSQSLCGECITCLASVECCIPCQKKKSSTGFCIPHQENKIAIV